MQLYNLKYPEERVDFPEAVLRGLGRDGGLFFPSHWPRFEDIDALLSLDFVERSVRIAERLLGEDFSPTICRELVTGALTFPAPLKPVDERISALELFHGPTLAFKDFGARFLAQCLLAARRKRGDSGPVTIVTATSGDTGAAVAHALHHLPGVQVVILFPRGRIPVLQEKLFSTLGDNIRTLAIDGDFDTCQALVKACFEDAPLVARYGLNSANSINIARLLAQCFYYFEAVAQIPASERRELIISVPSGNIGNLTAGLLAQRLGLPVKAFVAATNANDTVPRYLASGIWEVHPTVATLSNAMDVSAPNNWPRVEALFASEAKHPGAELRSLSFSEAQTIAAMRELAGLGYASEPHSAIAYAGLRDGMKAGERGIFLCTAHPAKFHESVTEILGFAPEIPEVLRRAGALPSRALPLPPDLEQVKAQIAMVNGG